MTQIVFDLDVLDRFAEPARRLVPDPACSLGIFPLTSYRLALRLHNEVPGIVVPQALQDALARRRRRRGRGRPGARASECSPRRAAACDGVYVVAPYRRPAARARASRLGSAVAGRDRLARGGERAADDRGRHPVARASMPLRAAKIVASTSPSAFTTGPPESPCRTSPRNVVTVRSTRFPYASPPSTAASSRSGRGRRRTRRRPGSRGSRPESPRCASTSRSAGRSAR